MPQWKQSTFDHTAPDVGYTPDQPVVWEPETRFIEESAQAWTKIRGEQSDGAFRGHSDNCVLQAAVGSKIQTARTLTLNSQ